MNEISIHQAMRTCEMKQVIRALQYDKISINQPDKRLGWTPLYKAVLYGDLDIVKMLVENGANVNLQNKVGESPLNIAIENNQKSIIKYLLDQKCNLNQKNNTGESVIHQVTRLGNMNLLQIIVKLGADINIQDQEGKTMFHYTCEQGNIELSVFYLQNGGNHMIEDKNSQTGFDFVTKQELADAILECLNNNQLKQNEDFSDHQSRKQYSSLRQELQLNVSSINQILQDSQNFDDSINNSIQKTINMFNKKKKAKQIENNLDNIKVDYYNNKENDHNQLNNKSIVQKLSFDKNLDQILQDKNEQKYEKQNAHKNENNNQKVQKPQIQQFCNKRLLNNIPKQFDELSSDFHYQNNYNVDAEVLTEEQKKIKFTIQKLDIHNNIQKQSIYVWLQDMKLEHLIQNFIDNQIFENVQFLKLCKEQIDWKNLLIQKFGIDKPGFHQRIIQKIKIEFGIYGKRGLFNYDRKKVSIKLPSVYEWLNVDQLGAYGDFLVVNGYEDLESLLFQMTTEEPITPQILMREALISDFDIALRIIIKLKQDADRASMVILPQNFVGEIDFECSGFLPGKNPICKKTSCSIF